MDDGYERAISRITELEVDLSQAVTGLKRSQADNESLLANQADLVTAYKRLQDHHERLRRHLHQEQEERHQLADEQQHQIALWRSQIDGRDRDIEELQNQGVPPREIDAIHLQLAEEIEEPYRQQVRDLEAQLSAEKHRFAETRRQMEGQRTEQKHMEVEARDQLADQAQRNEMREQTLQRQITTLEAELRTQMDAATGTWNLRMQMQEQEAKLLGLQTALQDQERCSAQERKAAADELLARGDEVAVARRRMHELQVELDAQERTHEEITLEQVGSKREQGKLSSQLAEAKAQLASSKSVDDFNQLQEELAQVRRTTAADREQLTKRASIADENAQSLQLALKHAEAKAKQLEEERAQSEREFQSGSDDTERAHAAEVVKVQAGADKSAREAETWRVASREREKDLARQLATSSSHAESLQDDLEQCQLSRDAAERQLLELRRDAQQRLNAAVEGHQKQLSEIQTDLATLRERSTMLERERNENAAASEIARAALGAQEQRADALQMDLNSLTQRLDSERSQWARDSDEAHDVAVRLEEERRSTTTQQLVEDHKRHITKLNMTCKKALHKAARKRQELKVRCQELVKRIVQLQQEKALAVRVCEENKGSYETRLSELGLVSRLGLGSVSVGAADVVGIGQPTVLRSDSGVLGSGVMHRRELRGIMERLEQNAERLNPAVALVSEPMPAMT